MPLRSSFGVGILVCALVAGVSPAQDTPGTRLGNRAPRRVEQPRIASPEYLIYQRAQARARQRAARLEAYRWMRIAPTRPTIPLSAYASDVNPGLYAPWGVETRFSSRW